MIVTTPVPANLPAVIPVSIPHHHTSTPVPRPLAHSDEKGLSLLTTELRPETGDSTSEKANVPHTAQSLLIAEGSDLNEVSNEVTKKRGILSLAVAFARYIYQNRRATLVFASLPAAIVAGTLAWSLDHSAQTGFAAFGASFSCATFLASHVLVQQDRMIEQWPVPNV